MLDKLPKRRPLPVRTIITAHNGERALNTELFYLEVGEKPADFLQRAIGTILQTCTAKGVLLASKK